MFSTLGPDTFLELQHAWALVDNYAHVNNYKDMHDLGDNLVQEHFVDPVVDMEKIAIHYRSLAALVQSLKKQGVRNINPNRNKGLTGKGNWQKFTNAYAGFCTEDNKYPLTYEVIYGHAWKGEILSSGGETRVPLSAIGVKKL